MGTAPHYPPGTQADLSACEREPIHIPGSIEPNGVLLTIEEPELRIVQASENTGDLLGLPAESVLGMRLHELVHHDSLLRLTSRVLPQDLQQKRRYLENVRFNSSPQAFDGLAHRQQGVLILELEPAHPDPSVGSGLYSSLTDALADLRGGLPMSELCQRTARHVRSLTGFDRVMIYEFLEDGTGRVVAEERRDGLVSYLGLRYPASDIPPQARRLYLLNTLRLKPDVNAQRVPLVPADNPVTGQPLDMSQCVLRAMSPVHVEYLRNMGVSASMSVSIIKDEKLWGLIACHHAEAKLVPHPIRANCEVLAIVFAAHIAAAEAEEYRQQSATLRSFYEQLQSDLRNGPDVSAALLQQKERLLSLVDAVGLALSLGGHIELFGATPPIDAVQRLTEWLSINQSEPILSTNKLSVVYLDRGVQLPVASGLLSARIAPGASDFILWFRPAVTQIVEWGGNPSKPIEETEAGKRISPRLSFERWKETVGDQSTPWKPYEREFASGLRQMMGEMLLVQQNQQVSLLNLELERSNIELDAFAYAASHDLQEPIRTIKAYTQLLTRRLGPNLEGQSRELLKVIENGTDRMGSLVTALLAYGQVNGNKQREWKEVSLQDVLRWVLSNLDELMRFTGAVIRHEPLPTIIGDPDQITQLMQNLISNALKYRRQDEAPCVEITAVLDRRIWQISVEDNGEGFKPDEAEIIFGAFKRLHGREIPGAGIGLALCRRIVEQHGGHIWAESKGKGLGAKFRFTLRQA